MQIVSASTAAWPSVPVSDSRSAHDRVLSCLTLRLVVLALCWHVSAFAAKEGHCTKLPLQAEMTPGLKSKLATTASPSGAMTQVTSQTASCSQAAAREHVTLGSKRHVMPCSGHTPPSPLADASQGAPTQPVQPLFSTQSGCARSMGPEGGLDRGVRPGSGSGSRGLGVRYCLSSSEPAVGAGIWEEQTTRHADFTA